MYNNLKIFKKYLHYFKCECISIKLPLQIGREPGALYGVTALKNRRFGSMREIVILACSECKRRNYTTTKNKKTMTGKLEIKKYCKFDKKHTLHKETK